MNKRAREIAAGVLGKKVFVPVYLFRDEFPIDDDAPVTSPRSANPGTMTITDTGNRCSVVGGKLEIAAGVAAVKIGLGAQTRAAGLAYFLQETSAETADGSMMAWHTSVAQVSQLDAKHGFMLSARAITDDEYRYAYTQPIYTPTMCLVLKATGCFYLIKNSNDWQIEYISNINNTATMYPVITVAANSIARTIDHVAVAQLGAPFTTEDFYTQKVASADADTTITGLANCVVEATRTFVTNDVYELSFRRVDDDNRFVVRCSQSGSTAKLIEINGGTETERASVAVTFTNGANFRIFAKCIGNTYQVFVALAAAAYDSLYVLNYVGASALSTATGAKVNLASTNFVAWPRILSGAALTEVSRYSPFDSGFTTLSERTLYTGTGETDWIGRPVLLDNGGTWIMMYRQGNNHSYDANCLFHLRFSQDYGGTWSEADKFTDGTSCVNAPFASTDEQTDGILILAPNGDILSQIYEHGAGTRQWRSTDDGKTWADEGIILTDATLVGGQDYAVIGTEIYITTFTDPASDGEFPFTASLYKSANNGTSWAKVSDIASGLDECGIVSTGGNNLLVVARDNNQAKTFQYTSTDLGANWSAQVDITSLVGVVQRPRLRSVDGGYILYGRHYQGISTMRDVIYFTSNAGTLWKYRHYLSGDIFTDCGYCDVLHVGGYEYYMVSYAGTKTAADLIDFRFTFKP